MSLLLNLGNSITAGTDPYQFYNFRERVLADGATVLSDTQVSDEIKRLRSLGLYSKFSALYTPAVRNTSKLYSIVSADGDATVTRGSVKNINSVTGTLEEIASNVTPSSFGTGGWGALVEGQRTNIWLRSEPADATGYATATNLTFVNASTNFTPAFATVNTVELLDATVSRALRQDITVVNGTIYTLSFFVKVGAGVLPNTGSGNYRDFTLTVDNSDVINYALITYQDVGGGVYRAFHTFTSTGVSAFNIRKYSGLNNNNRVEVTGFQLEAGSFASSYIKTEGATFTRSADVITKTGASDLIGQTEGTLFAVVDTGIKPLGASKRILALDNSSNVSTNRIQLIKSGSNDSIILIHTISGTDVTKATATNQSGMFKICATYTPTEIKLFANGVQISTTGTVTGTPALNQIGIGCASDGSLHFFDRILLAGISKTALTQAEAIALTT
jgi:hypothetical protein